MWPTCARGSARPRGDRWARSYRQEFPSIESSQLSIGLHYRQHCLADDWWSLHIAPLTGLEPVEHKPTDSPWNQIEEVTVAPGELLHPPGSSAHRTGRQVTDSGTEEPHRRVKRHR
jgi:hypothetical protein